MNKNNGSPNISPNNTEEKALQGEQGKYKSLDDFYKEKRQVDNVEQNIVDTKTVTKKKVDSQVLGKDTSGKLIYGATVVTGQIAAANEDDNIGLDGVVKSVDGLSKSKDIVDVIARAKRRVEQRLKNKEQSLYVEMPENINVEELDEEEKKTLKKDQKKAGKLKKDIKKGKYDSCKLQKKIDKKGVISVDDDLSNDKAPKGDKTYIVNKAINQTLAQVKKVNVDDNVGIEGVTVSVETAIKGKRAGEAVVNITKQTAHRAKGLVAYLRTYKGRGARGSIGKLGKDAVKLVKNISKFAVQTTVKTAGGLLVPLIIIMVVIYLVSNIATVSVPVMSELLSVYPAEPEDLTASSNQIGGEADNLYNEIETIEEQPEWAHIDEFVYDPNKDQMLLDIYDYDMFIIMAYLSSKYQNFTIADVQDEIQAIYNEIFVLEYSQVVEVKTRPDGHGGTETYNYYILNVILQKKETEEVIRPKITTQEEQDLYDTYTDEERAGAQQLVLNPFRSDWRENVRSRYGTRTYQMHGETVTDFHTGLDLAYPLGTPLYSGITGKVTSVKRGSEGYGWHIRMRTKDNNLEILYAHMSDIYVKEGDIVVAGVTPVGLVGSTGWSTGPHLHIEIFTGKNGNLERQDPIYFVGYATGRQDPNSLNNNVGVVYIWKQKRRDKLSLRSFNIN